MDEREAPEEQVTPDERARFADALARWIAASWKRKQAGAEQQDGPEAILSGPSDEPVP